MAKSTVKLTEMKDFSLGIQSGINLNLKTKLREGFSFFNFVFYDSNN